MFRALLDQLHASPTAIGRHVDPEKAWRILAESERRDAAAVAEILLYPTVGVWLTRAMHYTRPGRATTWSELGYLHGIAAAAAIRTGHQCTVRVPVMYGVVSLPTVGHVHIPGTFPVGWVDVVCASPDSRVQANDVVIPLDERSTAFTPARQKLVTSRGLTLRAWIEAEDPYHGFGVPRRPTGLTESGLAEWHKLLDEAWDILTLHHRDQARELAAGLRALGPVEPDVGTVGASSPAAFGGIRVSAGDSATDFAEALVHEMQHSKLNALLGLAKLTDDDNSRKYLAPWRDDPRPLVGVVHGVYAFTCGVEFWLAQEEIARDPDEARRVAFTIAYRRLQVRRALNTLKASGRLTQLGTVLVDAVSARLAVCERLAVDPDISHAVETIVDDHRALWRLRHVRLDTAEVRAIAQAWLTGDAAPAWSGDHQVTTDDERRLPANRRSLLRAKVTEPDLFTALMDGSSRADAALCTGDHDGAARAYVEHLRTEPDDPPAWIGLGLALRAQGRNAVALLEHPELTVAVHRQVRALGGRAPDPVALSAWLCSAL